MLVCERENKMCTFKIVIMKTDANRNVQMVVDTIMTAWAEENNTLPFMNRVLKVFPELENRIHRDLTYEEVWEIVSECVENRLEQENERIQFKVQHFQKLTEDKIVSAIQEMLAMFEMTYEEEIMFICYLGLFKPFPRSVITKECCVHYDVTDEVFLRSFIHEINHMILFDKWKTMHGYEKDMEPMYPDTLWYLEELAIEPTLNDDKIQNIIPIIHDTYASFKNMQIEGKALPEQIQDLYDSSENIEEFLNEAYKYIENHKCNF